MSLDSKVNSIINDVEEFSIKKSKIKTFLKALIECEGFISEAAEMCGIGRETCYRMIRQNKGIKLLLEEIRQKRRQSRKSKKEIEIDDDSLFEDF
jgi:hypothetical protein